MNFDQHLTLLRELFEANRNPQDAPMMERYMKNQFEFFGIKKPRRLEIGKAFFRQVGYPSTSDCGAMVQAFWRQPEREWQYFGNDLNEYFFSKPALHLPPDEMANHVEWCVLHQSWWDTVDTLAVRVAGTLFQHYPELIPFYTERWLNSDNIWLQRVCLLFQLKYKQKTDVNLLFYFIKRLSNSDAFFIQKAIGWALRELSNTDPMTVSTFCEIQPMPAFSKKEALKKIKKK